MKFRPCIDIHNGKVKQIVGSSLKDQGDAAKENFVAGHGAAYYADLFRRDHLEGGHIILLNHKDSPYFEATRAEALSALAAWPGGMQIGGGIHDGNAAFYLKAGASHVIVTSYVFHDGKISMDHIKKLEQAVGRDHIVLDLSCRCKDGQFYIMTDRWQKYTKTPLTIPMMEDLADHCDEFLVHAIGAEGKGHGIDEDLADLLAGMGDFPVTYAGGISSFEDLKELDQKCRGRVDATIGSALDLYGGSLPYRDVVAYCKKISQP